MTNNKLSQAAAVLAAAWNADRTCSGIPQDLFPQSVEQSYLIQDLMAAKINDTVVGWKIGFPPSGAISGRVFSRHLYRSPQVLSAVVHPEPNLECEIAFRIVTPPPRLTRPAVAADYAPIMKAFTAIELTGRRSAGAPHGPSNEWEVRDIVADNAAGAGLVIGPELIEWQSSDFRRIDVDLKIDDRPIPVIAGANERDLVGAVVDLANQLADRGLFLKDGDYISTGSLTEPTRLPVGSNAMAVFDNIGVISLGLA